MKNKTSGKEIGFTPLPEFALEIIEAGGLLEHIKKQPWISTDYLN